MVKRAAALDLKVPLEPGCFYHLFNRGNNKCNIFYEEKNYGFFWMKYEQFMAGFVDTYCFCLLPNHFHLLICVKSSQEILEAARVVYTRWPGGLVRGLRVEFGELGVRELRNFPVMPSTDFPDFKNLENLVAPENRSKLRLYIARWFVSDRLRCFFLGYSKAINKQEGREGSLFRKNFRRSLVDSELYFLNLVRYIHRNPEEHGIWHNMEDYPFSSFHFLRDSTPIGLQQDKLLQYFGGKQDFLDFHAGNSEYSFIQEMQRIEK